MEDSIELYNGRNNILVNNIDILKQPNQQLANAIATGPQDEFFSMLEECNRYVTGYNDSAPRLSVTPSWNWKPGTLNIIKDYVAKQLMLNKKSSGLGKYISRTSENARYRLSYLARKLESCEEKKRMLKREGYQHNVDIEEYMEKLIEFCDKIENSINSASRATNNRVTFQPFVHIPENERATSIYISCYIDVKEINVYQDETLIQKIPVTGVNIMFYCSLRRMMKYLDNPLSSNLAVSYTGINDAECIYTGNYRANQTTYHPYISQPSTDIGRRNSHWSTTCFSSFTDNIRRSFHNLNFVVLAMELLEWSGYYNTTHSNPYNNIVLSHFGMPGNFSRAYQTIGARDTENCSLRLQGKIFDKDAREFSVKNYSNMVEMTEYCREIDCVWRSECTTYRNYNSRIDRMLDDEYKYEIESLLGAMIEYFNYDKLWTILSEDFGCYIDNSLEENHESRDLVIYDYQDVINYLVMVYQDIDSYSYILKMIGYWIENKDNSCLEQIRNEDKIKEQMLQWATERSI